MSAPTPKQDFDAVSAPRQTILYHCIPSAPEGDAIRPSANYGMTIPQPVRDELGMGEGQVPLVFAATHFSKALAFGMKGTREGLLNTAVPGTDSELYLCCDRERMLARELDVTVHSFSGEGFVQLPHAERQSVSLKEVPFSRTTEVFKARSPQDLMRAGLQILSFRETSGELYKGDYSDHIIDRINKERGGTEFFPLLADLVREGRVVWENQVSGINPNPALGQILGVDVAAAPGVKAVAPKR